MTTIRPAAVAGSFYPHDADVLRDQVERYIAEGGNSGVAPKALIVPHAGYPYSGPIAGTGYAQLQNRQEPITRVVLIGPAHRVPVQGIAASSAGVFETPLGRIPLDRESIERLVELPQVCVNDEAHAPEHSLEVHLPFLQTVLGEFTLIPLVVGKATYDEAAEVLEQVWGGHETLIVVSSDLSHFHDQATATRIDFETSSAIAELRRNDLHGRRACGYVGIGGLLEVAEKRHMHVKVLDVRTSGDTAGSDDRVVGYGAFAVCEQDEPGASATGVLQ